ncbi:PKD domain-containing protein [Methanoregula sp.]|uniref:PKD domain-containing protein n=1 Tax=Methanoregula sp. TaxID=2052170 RepID=UPI002CA6F420|nr:PKD domain-containing protein [Methanoregula sp.]HVP96281.1 PKD domain-containing protein [Methanoregula sp.]
MTKRILFLLAVLVILGCVGPVSGQGYITVTNTVTANFFTSTRYGSAPFTVSFADTSYGGTPRTYLWDFGDGSTSTMENPSHTYLSLGEYTVRLTVTNQYGSDTLTRVAYIGVGDPPVPDFTTNVSGGTAPLAISFADTSTNVPTNWSWDFGDGSSSSGENPVHVYSAPGNYTVHLHVWNPYGEASVSRPDLLRVSPPPPVVPANQTGISGEQPKGFVDLIREARGTTEKNLPTAGLIPQQFMAVAAMLTSLAIVLIQFVIANISALAQFVPKVAKFFADLAGGHAVEKLNDKEIELRRLEARRTEQHFLGFSATEVLVIEAAVIMIALAFLLADRAALTLQMVLIYIAVGALSVVLHDMAHRYFATRHGHDADTRFWGLGTVIMFVTAWLYGNAFAQSYRNLVKREEDEEETREAGVESVAGPLVSLALMFLFLYLITWGGVFAVAGGIGFSINLVTAVYSLIPIETMDGLAVWRWNRPLYLLLFLPLIGFYLFTYVLVT